MVLQEKQKNTKRRNYLKFLSTKNKNKKKTQKQNKNFIYV